MTEKTDSRLDYIRAMIKARQGMGALVRNADNPFTKSKYADLTAVLDVIDDALLENGLLVEQWPGLADDGFVVVDTTITHVGGHTECHDGIPIPIVKRDAQGIGSAITYARRYALMSIFGLAPADDDGNAASGQKTQNKPQIAQNKPQANLSADVAWDNLPANGGQQNGAKQPAPMSDKTRKQLHAVGTQLYGDDWNDKRHELVASISKGQATSSNDLTEAEAKKLIAGINAKLAQAQQPDVKVKA